MVLQLEQLLSRTALTIYRTRNHSINIYLLSSKYLYCYVFAESYLTFFGETHIAHNQTKNNIYDNRGNKASK